MARQVQAIEVNKFNAGLITDASPLTTPDNSSLEEDNMVLNIDGSRNRRLGMDYEDGYTEITTSVTGAADIDIAVNNYKWSNVAGDPEKDILVVQVGNEVQFFNLTGASVSSEYFYTYTMSSGVSTKISFASVDGILVAANGDRVVYLFEYTDPDTITVSTRKLLVRDFFGVEDQYNGVDITYGSGVQTRPVSLSDEHIYNLRNQTWGIPRAASNDETVVDLIDAFQNATPDTIYPSNSDNVLQALYPDANDTDNRTMDRFWGYDLYSSPLGSNRAPMGYFIIDILDRGASRLQAESDNVSKYPELFWRVNSLPEDYSPNGPTVVSEFAGRIWYGGFTGEVIDGDSHSPKLASYILFSKIVESSNDINLCYQQGDPTSKIEPDIIATDGGFIRINEAYGIKKMINIGSALIIIATNGVWRVVGGDNGFTATTYIVEKLSDRGCTSVNSVVQVDNTVMFWSDDSIYHIAPDQFGSLVVNNISFGRIQNFYDNISVDSKRSAIGQFDSYERKVRWLYNNNTSENDNTKELVLDTRLQAFYTNTIKKYNGEPIPKVVSMYVGLPYTVSDNFVDVYVDTDQVFVGLDEVTVNVEQRVNSSQREIGYIVLTDADPVAKIAFAKYSNTQFRDWYSIDNIGVDADAYLITSYLSGTDFQRDKQVNYITVHLRRTETGYDVSMNPVNPSSCLTQARWGWANSDNSGKWGREFQAYRYRRMHLPLNSDDDYDNGFAVISSRNKLRGTGKVLSLKFRTEPFKDLHLYGWSMIFSVSENV